MVTGPTGFEPVTFGFVDRLVGLCESPATARKRNKNPCYCRITGLDRERPLETAPGPPCRRRSVGALAVAAVRCVGRGGHCSPQAIWKPGPALCTAAARG